MREDSGPAGYQHPDGPKIDLEISLLKSAKPALRKGYLLTVPGGPGVTGLDHPSELVRQLPAAVTDAYDLVGLDDRGVGQSTPVKCGLSDADRAAEKGFPFPSPNGDISSSLSDARRIADTCAQNAGDYLSYLTTANIARDLDHIRQTLGVPRISFYGTSYATYLGEVYATMFSSHTDRMVLDSVDPPGGVKQALNLDGLGAEQTFPDFAKWLAAQDSTLHFGTTASQVRATYFRLAAQLDRTPKKTPSGRVLDGNGLRAVTDISLTGPRYYPLASAVWQFAAAPAAKAAVPSTTLPTVVPDNLVSAQDAVICGDVAWSRDPATYATQVRVDRALFPLTNGMPGNVWPCAFWHYPPREPAVRPNTNGPRNIQLLQNLRDPFTSYMGARQTLAAFGRRAAMVSIDAGGHGVNLANPCVSSALSAFLLDGRPVESRCPQ
ncbi:alpha/beta fold hydrolase [Fodinicola feengrottensis]|uniref:Alpha/beta hydrolase n=1 Tax=Fodinicola feengrottensis TaxID=435914 RepID=A0ABN2ISG4_9ACTN|nr:alpha/beta fold hydrolase [Fodinicola feengrottensis]